MRMIKNAHIFTSACAEYKNGVIVFDDKIRFVGDTYTDDACECFFNYII